ncbi:MAG: type 1 glutamine amidotransferase [bacterium]
MTVSTGPTRAASPARKPVLFLQHALENGPGALAEILGECGLSWKCRRLFAGDGVPTSLDGCSVLVVLDDARTQDADVARAEIELVRMAVERDFPTIGIGRGAVLVAEAAGGRGEPDPGAAIGWHEVCLTADGRLDPAFRALPAAFVGLHWHRHSIAIPEGALRLAGASVCENQVFRVGQRVYGFQFHPEVTGWMVERWMGAEAAGAPDAADRLAALRRETGLHDDASRQRLRDLLRGLLPAFGLADAAGGGPVVNRTVTD